MEMAQNTDNKTDMKHSTVSSMSRKSQDRSQSDMKLQEMSNIKTVDGLLEVPSETDPKSHCKSTVYHRHS